MPKHSKTAITPTKEQDYPAWYQEVITASELAENSVTRGSMVIKPYGFAIWENIKDQLDKNIKSLGHQNAYFPLLIPLSLLQKEADHVDGFAKECAVVTHHRLQSDSNGQLQPDGKLQEPYIIRPTSEMIIGECFSRWIQSYRDLPMKINQWANVMRWEMRTRLFLRTSEFLWQEGHTAHVTHSEAYQHSLTMLDMYEDFCHNQLALPVIKGIKPDHERFPGAVETFCIESLMQDNKALQAGTSHFMGQNFAKSCNIEYTSEDGKKELAWTTSWGLTTRLIGALIMTHSDNNGLILPPNIAPYQIVIQPIMRKGANEEQIFKYCSELSEELNKKDIRVHVDSKLHNSWHWIKKGIPLRIEVGTKEIEQDMLSYFMRHKDHCKNRLTLTRSDFIEQAHQLLKTIQYEIKEEAINRQEAASCHVHSKEDLLKAFSSEQHPGFVTAKLTYNDITSQILDSLKASVRYIPIETNDSSEDKCILSGELGAQTMVLARAY